MEKYLKKEIIAPIIIILVCIFLFTLTKKLVYKIFKFKGNKISDARAKTIINLISNIVKFIIILISLLTILEIYGIDTKSLVASFGVVGLVVGLALQDIIKDFIIGVSIIFEGQYRIGDWVEIDGFKGEVIPSNLRTTKLRAYTGETKIISNRNISEIINYSLSKTNLLLDVDVAYESDINKVNDVLSDICMDAKKNLKVSSIECLGVQELSSSSIKFRLFITMNYTERLSVERAIKKEIVLAFNKNNITIPYNQVVVHNGQRI